MARKRLVMEPIKNERIRKACLKKRRAGLAKKATELNTLCGASLVTFTFDPKEHDALVAWPSREAAKEVVDKFRALPQAERYRKAETQESCLESMVKKVEDQFHKQVNKNIGTFGSFFIQQLRGGFKKFDDLDENDVEDLALFLKQKKRGIGKRLGWSEPQESSPEELVLSLLSPFPGGSSFAGGSSSGVQYDPFTELPKIGGLDDASWENWILDMDKQVHADLVQDEVQPQLQPLTPPPLSFQLPPTPAPVPAPAPQNPVVPPINIRPDYLLNGDFSLGVLPPLGGGEVDPVNDKGRGKVVEHEVLPPEMMDLLGSYEMRSPVNLEPAAVAGEAASSNDGADAGASCFTAFEQGWPWSFSGN